MQRNEELLTDRSAVIWLTWDLATLNRPLRESRRKLCAHKPTTARKSDQHLPAVVGQHRRTGSIPQCQSESSLSLLWALKKWLVGLSFVCFVPRKCFSYVFFLWEIMFTLMIFFLPLRTLWCAGFWIPTPGDFILPFWMEWLLLSINSAECQCSFVSFYKQHGWANPIAGSQAIKARRCIYATLFTALFISCKWFRRSLWGALVKHSVQFGIVHGTVLLYFNTVFFFL